VKKSVLVGALASAACVLVASAAQADGLAFNQNLAAPGVYYGAGNPNGDFVVDTEGGVEVALRAHVYQAVPIASVGDVYSFATAATNASTNSLSFDWSINPDVGAAEVAGWSALITVHDFANNTTVSFPGVFPDTNLHLDQGPAGGYQNSERLFFIDPSYDATQNNTFSVNLTLTNVSSVQGGTISVNEVIQQGSGAVPEPASWALMILGFGGAGAMLRRRKTAAAAAA
jgi:hypothetical protein